jgi:hypothetical protein
MLVTAISDAHATRISTFLLNKLPTSIEAFYESIIYHVILRLSHTFRHLPFTSGKKPDGLDDNIKHQEIALAALNELRKLLQDEEFYKRDIVTKTNKRRPQLTRPSELSADMEGVIQRFETLGHRFPKTRLSAEETIQKIMETQRRILKVIRHRHLPHL